MMLFTTKSLLILKRESPNKEIFFFLKRDQVGLSYIYVYTNNKIKWQAHYHLIHIEYIYSKWNLLSLFADKPRWCNFIQKKERKKLKRRNKFRYYRGAPVNDGIDHGNVTDAELYRILTFIVADMFMHYL
jgi:hypothetical protein